MAKRRKNDPEGARRSIVAAMRSLFAEQGFRATTIQQIAQRAGVTKSLIHHHFGNKLDLWHETKNLMFADYFEAQRQLLLNNQPDLEVIGESMRLYFNFLRNNPDLTRIMAWMNLERDEGFEDVNDGLVEISVARLRMAQERGAIRKDVSVGLGLAAFFSMAEHWFIAKNTLIARFEPQHDDDAVDDAYLDTIIKLLLEGLGSKS